MERMEDAQGGLQAALEEAQADMGAVEEPLELLLLVEDEEEQEEEAEAEE